MVVLQCPVCGAGVMPGDTRCMACFSRGAHEESRRKAEARNRQEVALEQIADHELGLAERYVRAVGVGVQCSNQGKRPIYRVHPALASLFPEFAAPVGRGWGENATTGTIGEEVPEMWFEPRELARWYADTEKASPPQVEVSVRRVRRRLRGWREEDRRGWRFSQGSQTRLAEIWRDAWIFLDGETDVENGFRACAVLDMSRTLPPLE